MVKYILSFFRSTGGQEGDRESSPRLYHAGARQWIADLLRMAVLKKSTRITIRPNVQTKTFDVLFDHLHSSSQNPFERARPYPLDQSDELHTYLEYVLKKSVLKDAPKNSFTTSVWGGEDICVHVEWKTVTDGQEITLTLPVTKEDKETPPSRRRRLQSFFA